MGDVPGRVSRRHIPAGTAQESLDALRKASTSYYKGKDALWVKIVSTGDVMGTGPTQGKGPGDSIKVSR